MIKYILTTIMILLCIFIHAQDQQGGILTNTNFAINAPLPVDGRDTLTTLADTSGITWLNPGLWTYVDDVDQYWFWDQYWRNSGLNINLSTLGDTSSLSGLKSGFIGYVQDVDQHWYWTGSFWKQFSGGGADLSTLPAGSEITAAEKIVLTDSLATWQQFINQLRDSILADEDKGDIDVTGSGATWTIDTGAVTSLKILDGTIAWADIATAFQDSIGRVHTVTLLEDSIIVVKDRAGMELSRDTVARTAAVIEDSGSLALSGNNLIHVSSLGSIDTVSLSGITSGSGGVGGTDGRLSKFITADSVGNSIITEASGAILINTTTNRSVGGADRMVLTEGTASSPSPGYAVIRNSNDAGGPTVYMGKSRGTTVGSNTIVADADVLGVLGFLGANGSSIGSFGATIVGLVDGTPSVSSMPGRLNFNTTPVGATTPVLRATITPAGDFGIGLTNPSAKLHVSGTGRIDGNTYLNGDVGVGINPASTRFHVVGNTYLNGNVGIKVNPALEDFHVDGDQILSGQFLMGTTSNRAVGGINRALLIEGTGGAFRAGCAVVRNTNDSGGPTIYLAKSRGTTVGSNTIIADGDVLGVIGFVGANGTDLNYVGASISAYVNGTPSGSSIPAKLRFETSLGPATPTSRMQITERVVYETGIEFKTTTVSASGTTAVSGTDYRIRINAATGAQTYILPTPTNGRRLEFFRVDDNPATVITFTGTINGATNPTSTGGGSPVSVIASRYGSFTLTGNGTSFDLH